MTDEDIIAIRDEHLPSQGEQFDCIVFARAILKESREELAGRLIDVWCDHHGKKIPWAKAVEISTIVTGRPPAEHERLLGLDERPNYK